MEFGKYVLLACLSTLVGCNACSEWGYFTESDDHCERGDAFIGVYRCVSYAGTISETASRLSDVGIEVLRRECNILERPVEVRTDQECDFYQGVDRLMILRKSLERAERILDDDYEIYSDFPDDNLLFRYVDNGAIRRLGGECEENEEDVVPEQRREAAFNAREWVGVYRCPVSNSETVAMTTELLTREGIDVVDSICGSGEFSGDAEKRGDTCEFYQGVDFIRVQESSVVDVIGIDSLDAVDYGSFVEDCWVDCDSGDCL